MQNSVLFEVLEEKKGIGFRNLLTRRFIQLLDHKNPSFEQKMFNFFENPQYTTAFTVYQQTFRNSLTAHSFDFFGDSLFGLEIIEDDENPEIVHDATHPQSPAKKRFRKTLHKSNIFARTSNPKFSIETDLSSPEPATPASSSKSTLQRREQARLSTLFTNDFNYFEKPKQPLPQKIEFSRPKTPAPDILSSEGEAMLSGPENYDYEYFLNQNKSPSTASPPVAQKREEALSARHPTETEGGIYYKTEDEADFETEIFRIFKKTKSFELGDPQMKLVKKKNFICVDDPRNIEQNPTLSLTFQPSEASGMEIISFSKSLYLPPVSFSICLLDFTKNTPSFFEKTQKKQQQKRRQQKIMKFSPSTKCIEISEVLCIGDSGKIQKKSGNFIGVIHKMKLHEKTKRNYQLFSYVNNMIVPTCDPSLALTLVSTLSVGPHENISFSEAKGTKNQQWNILKIVFPPEIWENLKNIADSMKQSNIASQIQSQSVLGTEPGQSSVISQSFEKNEAFIIQSHLKDVMTGHSFVIDHNLIVKPIEMSSLFDLDSSKLESILWFVQPFEKIFTQIRGPIQSAIADNEVSESFELVKKETKGNVIESLIFPNLVMDVFMERFIEKGKVILYKKKAKKKSMNQRFVFQDGFIRCAYCPDFCLAMDKSSGTLKIQKQRFWHNSNQKWVFNDGYIFNIENGFVICAVSQTKTNTIFVGKKGVHQIEKWKIEP